MIEQDEEQISTKETQAPEFRLAVVVLSIVLGVVTTAGIVGAYWHFQASSSMQAEIKSVKAKLKEKSLALDEMKTQVEALSKQMHALREHSVARSGVAQLKDAQVQEAPPAPTPAALVGDEPAARTKAVAPDSTKKNTKRPSGTCELAGKSPEEQAATLKRCVELIDAR